MPTTKNPILGDRAKAALLLAFDVHKTQTRKGRGADVPYWNHISTVAGMVLELKGTEDEYIAALFHDSIEDRPRELAEIAKQDPVMATMIDPLDENTALSYISAKFGQNVADLVADLTDAKLPDAFRKLPPAEKAVFVRRSREAKIAALRKKSDSVRKIKACDALHNARSLLSDFVEGAGPDVWRVFAGGAEGTLWYYSSLADVFYEQGPARAGVELRWIVKRIRAMIVADEGQ